MSILHCLIQVYNASHNTSSIQVYNTSSIQVYNTINTLIDVKYSRRSIIVRACFQRFYDETPQFREFYTHQREKSMLFQVPDKFSL